MNRNCYARSIQNMNRLKNKVFIPVNRVSIPFQAKLSIPHVPERKYAEDYVSVFVTGDGYWGYNGGMKPRRTLNQRQKRKQNRQ